MNREEIIDHIIALLRQHEENENKVRLRGSIHQEPYKVDFFKLFAAAFNAGMMANDPQPQDYLSAELWPKEPRTLSIAKRSATCTHSGRNGPTLGSTAMSFTGRGCQTVFRLKHFLRRHLRIAYRSGAELKMREAVEQPARSDEATRPLG